MSDFIIEDIATETVENPYTGHVAALIEAGEGKQLTIVVARGTKRQSEEDKAAGVAPVLGDGGKDKLAFQQAANAAGYTARVVKEAVQEDETKIALSFKLTPKNKRAGKTRGETAPEAATEAAPEVETETAPEVETETAPATDADVTPITRKRR